MGSLWSSDQSNLSEEQLALIQSKSIDQIIRKEAWIIKNMVKLLLLGASNSGKTTFSRQLQLIHGSGYSEDERRGFKSKIFQQVIQDLSAILQDMSDNQVEFQDPLNTEVADVFLKISNQIMQGSMNTRLGLLMMELWLDPGVKLSYQLSLNSKADDSTAFFLDSLTRLADPNYIPNDEDIIRVRVPTKSVSEITFHVKGIQFMVTEIGGFGCERGKWISYFDDVSSVIFLAAISDFGQVPSGGIEESLNLFESICNAPTFKDISMILFLNKMDLFLKKIQAGARVMTAFSNYDGVEGDAKAMALFALKQFMDRNQTPAKLIYAHFSCAIETSSMRFLFSALTDMIIRSHLATCGMY
ncbi:hypothetical protein TCAL_12444 [Tigriopus californicus]|uniref:Uncharacterized protein n=1 Tax=Tigriopus californicus TaxID=6832 RepID=A0A553PKC1_TIGCA|nr:G protein alpha i subunit-like [Tigriopus californicus]TRY78135.1 hypothetical protein TCAL_12444 [Tigriopus californicus]|eukprot:TCALIF_12444-PA protein Name:"Similar to Gnai1 Guanine nucleotide-binding protein G(i) subunit alpha-1 (Rattus norvegicus)" AED:0.01 eAED:0.01 QI:0/-1/0/1/-1/1/1/0/356